MTQQPDSDGLRLDPPAIGPAWDGRLEEWLAELAHHDPDGKGQLRFQSYSFPTDDLLSEYVASIDTRQEGDVRALLRWLLFDRSTFGADHRHIDWIVQGAPEEEKRRFANSEYARRILSRRRSEAQPGVRWVLDLLPDNPRHAIAAIEAYLTAFIGMLPDGRIEGLWDAITVISARYLKRRGSNGPFALQSISPRELEQLTARFYTAMGYSCELTPPGRDGGRDVIANRTDDGRRERRLIDCKHYSGAVPIKEARALLGTVSHEHATVGVLLTTGRMTRGTKSLRDSDSRLNLVDGVRLCDLLDEHFGSRWPEMLDYWLQWPPR